MRFIVWLVLICAFSGQALAQDFENIRATQEGTRMIIIYDLVSVNPNATFTVAPYSSHNNFSTPVLWIQRNRMTKARVTFLFPT